MNLPPPQFAPRLLAWFDMYGRHSLPWQSALTPYRVWVSEIMLQQTQVSTVIPYYERFMARFPTLRSLAGARLDEVMYLWTGLGYYARARNLHACAITVMTKYQGEFPQHMQAMADLPGIGRSTAGAILSICTGQRHPILDGNVKRVLARVFGIAGDPSSSAVTHQLWSQAEACTPTERVGAYTQAIMDLGATVCTRTRPACTVCPMNLGCIAALQGRQAELPGSKQKRARPSRQATLLIAQRGASRSSSVLVERRPPTGLWGGLWSPPQFASEREAMDWCTTKIGRADVDSSALAPIEHAFTHFDLTLNPLRVRCDLTSQVREDGDLLWYRLESPPRIGLPQPIAQLFERLRDSLA